MCDHRPYTRKPAKNLWTRISPTAIQVNLGARLSLAFKATTRHRRPLDRSRRVTVENRDGDLFVDDRRVVPYTTPEQEAPGSVRLHEVLEHLKEGCFEFLHPNVADALHANPELIPESWKTRDDPNSRIYILFWGKSILDTSCMINRDCVRGLTCSEDTGPELFDEWMIYDCGAGYKSAILEP